MKACALPQRSLAKPQDVLRKSHLVWGTSPNPGAIQAYLSRRIRACQEMAAAGNSLNEAYLRAIDPQLARPGGGAGS